MKAIIDTHALIWFLENNPRLGKKAKEIMQNTDSTLIVPVIVLCEFYYYLKKKNQTKRYKLVFKGLTLDPRISLVAITHDLILNIPLELEMHDGLIAAITGQDKDTYILSKDPDLKKWNQRKIIWD